MDKSLETLKTTCDWFLYDQTGRSVGVGLVLFYVLVWWRILARAGFPGGLALLMLIPPIALTLWVYLAFAPWPARRELAALRKVQRVMHDAERRRLIA
jgi:hypothetical protein